MTPPFHRLLRFYSARNPHDQHTLRLQDSIAGNLSLGLSLPVSCLVALARHLFLCSITPRPPLPPPSPLSSLFSLDIHIPSVPWSTVPLHSLPLHPSPPHTSSSSSSFSLSSLSAHAYSSCGLPACLEAVGLWSLAADSRTGQISSADLIAFRDGTLFAELERRRKRRSDAWDLSCFRGGPVWKAGHSWVVRRVWGVEVYR